MCIFAYAKPNVVIDDDYIEASFENNPDGAGIMWQMKGGVVHIEKGFMDVKSLLKAWHKLPIEAYRAYHCRIATAGKIGTPTCHPFPIRECTEAMGKGKDITDVAVMHNGIISLTNPVGGMSCAYSDTMMFAKEVLYPIKHALNKYYIQKVIEGSISRSRMLIFSEYHEPVLLGTFVKEGDIYFSNDSYNDKWYTYSSYTNKPYSCSSSPTTLPAKTATVTTPVTTPVTASALEVPTPPPVETKKKEEDTVDESPYKMDGSINDSYGFEEDEALFDKSYDKFDDEMLAYEDELTDKLAETEEYGSARKKAHAYILGLME